MNYTTLGRTGIRVSVAGIGTGGHSRIGLRSGLGESGAASLIHRALDSGVTLVDTAEFYGTESVVARVLQDRARDEIVISSKASVDEDGRLRSGSQLRAVLEATLRRLGTDHIDLYHLHAVPDRAYDHAVEELWPVLDAARAEGTIRAVGITEPFAADPGHAMLSRAAHDPRWDVVMVGFNILNQSARELVIEPARRVGIGVLGMFAVRSALRDVESLAGVVSDLVADGYLDGVPWGDEDALVWLSGGVADSLPELAYRFCRAQEGIESVLFGTGNADHLDENLRSLLAPRLPDAVVERIRHAFGGLSHMSGN